MTEKNVLVVDIFDNLHRLSQVVHERSRRNEPKTGLTGAQLWIVTMLAEGGPVRVSEIARRMRLQPATTVGILDRLENQGVVARRRSVTDRREVMISLTERGAHLAEEAPETAQMLLAAGLEQASLAELKRISSALKRMASLLGVRERPRARAQTGRSEVTNETV